MTSDQLQRIWWIASYPKSGSTWVRMFVNAYLSGFEPHINSAWQYATGDLQPHLYQLTAAQPINQLGPTDFLYYRPAALLNSVYTANTRDIALKTHHANWEMDGIRLIPPRLTRGALYIVRDPRDVCPSYADHLGVSVDDCLVRMAANDQILTKDGFTLYHVLGSWSSHVDSWTVHNTDVPTHVVRYEDLRSQPETFFPKVLQALGIDPGNRERLDFALEATQLDRLRAQEDAHGFKERGKGERFFRAGQVGGWRDVLTPEQAEQIEQNHRLTMERFGYLEAQEERPKANTLGRPKSVASGSVA